MDASLIDTPEKIQCNLRFELKNERATELLAQDIALAIKPGDCVALSGDLGAGKTTLTRAIIRAVANQADLEVPSPTFTLVQQYDLRVPIGHFDLYRISDPSEIFELGLEDILKEGAAFIEWPEMAFGELPDDVITFKLTGLDEARHIEIDGPSSFLVRLDRSLLIRQFLEKSGFVNAQRSFYIGDASTRTYERVTHSEPGDFILMNAPKQPDGPIIRGNKTYSEIAHLAEDVVPYVAIGGFLNSIGLNAPQIFYSSIEDGILIIEDLGDEKPVDDQNVPIPERYLAAVDVLAWIHSIDIPNLLKFGDEYSHKLSEYDYTVMQMEIELLTDWYLPFKNGQNTDEQLKQEFISIWHDLFKRLNRAQNSLVLRDYHSPNILWQPNQSGLDQIGIIDFQDALIGPCAYDVASMAQDARVTVSEELEAKILDRYKAQRFAQDQTFDANNFDEAYAIMAAQRASKVIGIFVRLNDRDGKSQYLKHIPRIEQYLTRLCSHSVLKPLRDWLEKAHVL